MSLLFIENWGHNSKAIADSRGWSNVGSTPTGPTTTGRHVDSESQGSAYAFEIQEGAGYKSPGLTTFGTPRVLNLGLRFDNDGANTTSGFMIKFFKSGTVQCTAKLCSDGYWRLYRSTGTLLSTAPNPVTLSRVAWTTINNNIDNSGTSVIKYAGVEVLSFSGDNQQAASSGWDQVSFEMDVVGGVEMKAYISDIVVTDATTGELVECSALDVALNADGSVLQLTPSTGVVHYSLLNGTPPVNTTYNEALSAGLTDLLGGAPVPYAAASYLAVQLCIWCAVDTGAVAKFKTKVKSGPTTDASTAVVPGSAGVYSEIVPKIWETDPNTSTAWVEASINSGEFGYESAA